MELVQDSPEWHSWRETGLGASDIAAVIGVSPYDTPHGVWLVKTKRAKGFSGNSFTEHGKETEAKARALYELFHLEDMPPGCATHPTFKMCLASLDGIRADNKLILEIKCPSGRDTIDAALVGKVPDQYIPQVQYQLAVTGADKLHFFVYHEASEQHALVEVVPDLEYQGKLVASAADFWNNHVLADVAPALTDRDVKEVTDNGEIISLCKIINESSKTMQKEKLDVIKARIIHLGGHPKIKCGNVQISSVNRNGKFSFNKLTIKPEQTT